MNSWALALAVSCAAVNVLGAVGGRQTLKTTVADDREARATAWYLIVRSVAIAIAAVFGGLGVAYSWPLEMTGWVLGVAMITLMVQLLDVPVWLSRRKRWWAAGALGLASVVFVLGILALPPGPA